MSVTIIHKKGSGIPSAESLEVAEIAVDVVTGKLYTKTDDGKVVEISGSGGGGDVDHSNYIDKTKRNDVVEGDFQILWDDSADPTFPFNGRLGYNKLEPDPNAMDGSFLYVQGTRGKFSIGRDGDVELHGPSEIQGIPDNNDERPWITGFSYVQANDFLDADGNSIIGSGGGGGFVHIGEAPPADPVEGQEWLEIPADGDATMWLWDGDKWLQHPSGGGSGDVDLSDYYTKAESEAKFLETESDPTVGAHIKAITPEQINAWDNPTGGGGMEYEIDQPFEIALPVVNYDGTPTNALIIKYPNVSGALAQPPILIESPSNPSIKFVARLSDGTITGNAVFGFSWNGNNDEGGFQIGANNGSSENNGGNVDLGLNHLYSQFNWLRNCRITGTYTGTTSYTSRSFQNGAPVIDARELISVLSDLRDVTKDSAVTSVESLKTAMSSRLDSLVDRLTRGIEESRAVDEDAWAYTTMSEDDYNEFMRDKYGEPENE